MTTRSEPFRRDNHYVPCLYLRGFADGDDRVSTYRLLVAHSKIPLWKPKSLRGIAYRAYLYTRITARGETDEIEKWLEHDFETPATVPLRKAISDEPLTSEDWHRIIRFVGAQDVRTPARLVENLQRWQKELPDLMQGVLEDAAEKYQQAKAQGTIAPVDNDLSRDIPIRVSKQIRRGEEMGALRAQIISGRGLWLFSLKHVLTHTVNALLENRWTILKPPDGLSWFTSDDPVIRLNYYGEGRYDFKGGWGNPGTEILLPISSQHLLYTKVGHRPPLRGEKPTQTEAQMFRHFIAEHAHRMIIAAAPDDTVQELRPRTTDAELIRSEDEQWKQWHRDQSAPERALMGS